jgi:hypothetical protein
MKRKARARVAEHLRRLGWTEFAIDAATTHTGACAVTGYAALSDETNELGSAECDAQGAWTIQPAELHRVFAPLSQLPAVAEPVQAHHPEAEIALLRAMLEEMRSTVADLRRREDDLKVDRDHWREAHSAMHRLLPKPAPAPEEPMHWTKRAWCHQRRETIARKAKCGEDTVARAIVALEQVGILSWCNRLARVTIKGVVKVIRTSNAYWFNDPGSKSEFKGGTRFTVYQERKQDGAGQQGVIIKFCCLAPSSLRPHADTP